MLKAKKGRVLISDPSLKDPVFFKSVVLLTHHNNDETIGLVLNNPTKIKLNDILENVSSSDFLIYLGGPVEKNTIQFLHTLGDTIPESKQILEGLYWGGNFDVVLELINSNKISNNQIRFFAGYSGWGIEQLNNEIREDSWLVQRSTKEVCMQYSNAKLWSDIIKKQSGKYAIWANLPKDPSLN